LRQWADGERAFRDFVNAFASDVLEPAAQFNLGVCLQNQGKYLPAAEEYEKLTAEPAAGRPAPPQLVRDQALLQRGQCLFAAARYVDAIPVLLAAEATNDAAVLADARYGLGRCYQFSNEPAKAKACYLQVIAEHAGTEAAAKAKLALAEIGG
jgi:TolA-binding protein